MWGPVIKTNEEIREDYDISDLISCETNRLGINVTLCLSHQTQLALYVCHSDTGTYSVHHLHCINHFLPWSLGANTKSDQEK